MEGMRQPPHARSLSLPSVSANSRAQTYSHTLTGKITPRFSTRVSFLYYSLVNKGALHSQRNLSPVSFRNKKSLKRGKRSEKVVVVSNLQAAGLPERPECGSEARGSWRGPFSPGSVCHKNKPISRNVSQLSHFHNLQFLNNLLVCSFSIFKFHNFKGVGDW